MSDLTDQISERLRAEKLATLMRHFPGVMLTNICNATVFVTACWNGGQRWRAAWWASCVLSIVGVMVFRQWRRRAVPSTARLRNPHGFNRLILYALALGVAWGALPLLFFPDATVGGKLLIVCLTSGMLGGGVFVLASVPAAAIAFSAPIATGSLVALLRVGDAEHLLMAVVLAGYSAILFLGSFTYERYLRNLIRTQIRAEGKASSSARNLGTMAEMAAGLAHEISQPLAAAATYIRSVERLLALPADKRPFPVEKPLRQAATQLENARQIIGNLRGAITNHTVEREPLALNGLIRDVIDAVRQRGEELNVHFETKLTARDDIVLANPTQMRQLFTNLFSNALDAMASAERRELAISSYAVGEKSIRIDVADSGVGISPAIRPRLFEPLFTTKEAGLGVGLSITKAIVEAHDGQIWAEPNCTGGTIFAVVLPIERRTRRCES